MAAAVQDFLIASILLSCLVSACHGSTTFSSLKQTLDVTSSTKPGQVLKGGEDNITISWSLNSSLPAGTDSDYKTVKIKLCYAPISQKDRGWRKTEDELKKDKTCQHKVVARPYSRANNTVTWTVQRDVPTATYFVRAYALDSHGKELGYGQTTDAKKAANLFDVEAISGRHVSLDIASVCFSAFSVVSLGVFFFLEKRRAKAK